MTPSTFSDLPRPVPGAIKPEHPTADGPEDAEEIDTVAESEFPELDTAMEDEELHEETIGDAPTEETEESQSDVDENSAWTLF